MSYKDQIHEMRGELRVLYKAIPGATKGFADLSKAVHDEGVLEPKMKEMIAVGIAVAQHCQPCLNYHIEALMRAGATREELGDTLAMAVQMGGGPALMYAGHALACWDELEAARATPSS
jgi:AhpD family alkylhydroperoxidase